MTNTGTGNQQTAPLTYRFRNRNLGRIVPPRRLSDPTLWFQSFDLICHTFLLLPAPLHCVCFNHICVIKLMPFTVLWLSYRHHV